MLVKNEVVLNSEFGVRSIKIKLSELRTNIKALNSLSLRGAKRRSNPRQNEIAMPFWLAMTCKNDKCVCINHFEHRTLNFKGVTLIEVILIMVIIGILAAIVIPKINFSGTSSRASVDGAAYMIASDIRYAQEWAMANRVSKTVTFSTATPTVYAFGPPSNLDPSGRLPGGATISSDFSITFNSLGEPVATAPPGVWSVTVSGGVVSRTITVTNYTGKVS